MSPDPTPLAGEADPSAPPLVRIENLSVDFRTDDGLVRAVDDVSLTLRPREILGLVGESGSGKSVTAKTLMQLNPGNVVYGAGATVALRRDSAKDGPIDGAESGGEIDVLALRRPRDLKLVRGGAVSMIFQEPMASFAPALTVGRQMSEMMRFHLGVSAKEARERGVDLLDQVGIPDPRMRFDQYVFELSGGMRQRAMIAMALSTEPKVLVADEPTTALDVTTQERILELMLSLRDRLGMAMIFITHDLGVIGQIADNVVVMKRGRIEEAGPTRQVLQAPSAAYTRRLIDALPSVARLKQSAVPADAPPVVTVRALTVTYPLAGGVLRRRRFTAVKDASLVIRRGQIVGLVGESGSGKTTIGRAILKAAPISGGTITFHGEDGDLDIGTLTRRDERVYRRAAQLVFQDPYGSLNPRMTVRDIIAEPLEAMRLTASRAETDRRVREMAAKCRLELEHLRRFPHAFSGGQRQRVSIARALVAGPKFLIADEAVAALDVSIQAEILDLLKQLQADLGLTILFISHDLGVIANLCDHIVVMRHGEIVESGSAREIFLSPQQPYTQRLIAAAPTLEKAFAA